MKIPRSFKKKRIASFLSIISLSFFQASQAAVIVEFKQEDRDNVRMSWSGTLSLSGVNGTFVVAFTQGGLGSAWNYNRNGSDGGDDLRALEVGVAVDLVGVLRSDLNSANQNAAFGFAGNAIYWDASVLSMGSITSPTELSFDPALNYIIVPGTLSGLGADSFSNSLAWTANITGDEVRYTSNLTPVVPETSSSLLGLMGLGAVALRRRR